MTTFVIPLRVTNVVVSFPLAEVVLILPPLPLHGGRSNVAVVFSSMELPMERRQLKSIAHTAARSLLERFPSGDVEPIVVNSE
jgi:hypothetical protein